MSKTKFTVTGADGFIPPTECCKLVVYGDDVSDGTHSMNELKRGFVGKLVLIQLSPNDFVVGKHIIDYKDGDGMNVPIYTIITEAMTIGMAITKLAEMKNGRSSP